MAIAREAVPLLDGVETSSAATPHEKPDEFTKRSVRVRLFSTEITGIALAVPLLATIGIMTWLVFRGALVAPPPVPQLPVDLQYNAATAALVDQSIKTYNQLSSDVLGRAIQLFDATVVRALLPLLGTVIGYIFGARQHAKDRDQ